MSQGQSSSTGQAMPSSLHDIIIDYVYTQAYSSTAKILSQKQRSKRSPAPPPPNHPTPLTTVHSNGNSDPKTGSRTDIEGDESMADEGPEVYSTKPDTSAEISGSGSGSNGIGNGDSGDSGSTSDPFTLTQEDIQSIERRRAVINYILNGAVIRAIEIINTHFPSVLDVTRPTSPIPAGSTSASGSGTPGFSAWSRDTLSSRQPNAWSSNGYRSFSSPSPGPGSSLGLAGTSIPKSPFLSNQPPSPVPGSVYGTFNGFGSGRGSSNDPDHSSPVFPNSTHPSHVSLNLQIQQFIESFRQLTPSSPSSSVSSISSSLTSSMHLPPRGTNGTSTMGMTPTSPVNETTTGMAMSNGKSTNGFGGSSSTVTLTHALTAAQGLHTEAKKLPPDVRAVYLQEIKDVGALFAYTDPETSILKGFLDQNRRIALANQVNKAILKSQGHPTSSLLENISRRTSALYTVLDERGIDPRPVWAEPTTGKEVLAAYWKRHTGSVSRFRLRDFVGQSW